MRRWSTRDRALAKALLVVERTTHRCGHPIDQSTDDEYDGAFLADDELVCHACAAIEQAQKEQKTPVPGTIWRAVLDPEFVPNEPDPGDAPVV